MRQTLLNKSGPLLGGHSSHIAGIGCRLVEQNRCLSGYYFASRVIYPALLPKGKRAVSSSIVNAYFSGFPP